MVSHGQAREPPMVCAEDACSIVPAAAAHGLRGGCVQYRARRRRWWGGGRRRWDASRRRPPRWSTTGSGAYQCRNGLQQSQSKASLEMQLRRVMELLGRPEVKVHSLEQDTRTATENQYQTEAKRNKTL
ncbi:hypothetical protein ACQJBY_007470 [Aegilops geniculata]